jgi:membrane protease YdiL (CAAX protease family)
MISECSIKAIPHPVVLESDLAIVAGVIGTLLRTRRVRLFVEFLVLYVGLVAGYALLGSPGSPLVPLAVWAAVAFVYLWRRNGFDRRGLWRPSGLRMQLPSILRTWAIAAVVGVTAVALVLPDHLFDLPRRSPSLWLAVMVFYPLFSVYPQELVYRAFLLERYGPVFGGGRAAAMASAAVFGFVHIIFGNWLSVVLTVLGGFLFARRYQRSRSLLAASVEHSLYGMLIFTIGLGSYFYHGTW